MEWLDGKKTYTTVGAAFAVVLAWQFGYIDKEALDILLTMLGFTGLAALRHGVAKTED